MKKSILLNLFLFVGLTLCLSITANAQERAVTADISRTISYQGLLRTADGTSADGVHQVTVRLYADQSGTEPIWQDEFTTEVSGGVFNVQLGSQKPLPASTSLNSSLWVSVQIGQTAEMRPVQMSASPYALNVANNSITADKMATNYIGSISINGQKVTGKGADVNFVAGDGLALQVDPVTNAIVVSSNATAVSGSENKGGISQGQPVTDVTASAPLASSGGTTPNISLTGVVAIANGGTGSSTKNFVDLSTAQSVGGAKTFTSAMSMSNNAITNLATPSASTDASTKGYVDGINTSLTASITSEAATRSANDNTLTNNLNSEIANRQSAVTGEATARTAADNTLTASVTSEASARASADNTLTNNLNAEVTNRTSAVASEASARTAADASEASARAAGDASEASARTTADNTLTASVASEASTRAAADNTLTTNLNAEIARAEAAEAAFSSASITAQINDAVAAEATLRSAADATESSARTTADNTLTANLNTEITNRQAADASEAATRASAVSTVTTNLNNEISARQSAITTEAASRTSADNALTSALQAETAARIAGDEANDVGSQDLDMQGHSIVNVVDPSNAQDVATKNYVDLSVGTIFRDYTGFGDGNYTGHTSTVYGSTDNVTNLIGYSAFVYGTDDDNIGVQTTAYGQGAGNAIGGDFNATNFDGSGYAIGGRFSATGAANNIAVQATNGSIQVATAGEGMILKSPSGNCFKLTVDDDGVLTTSAVTCP